MDLVDTARMTSVATLTFRDARECRDSPGLRRANRDYPPLARSVRDGFAARAADTPGTLRVIGEVRAGEVIPREVNSGEALEITTRAPVPRRRRCRHGEW